MLNSPLAEEDASAFEQEHGVHLPSDYRHFITDIGNGGAGPYYGVFPLGKYYGSGRELESWEEGDGFIGDLSEPFPHSGPWNDLQGKPPDEMADTNEQAYEKQCDEFDARYFHSSHLNGAIPVCEIGCALRIWLVLTGAGSGHLWYDGRADYTGLRPLLLAGGSPANFSSWYDEWLQNALAEVLVDPPGTDYRQKPLH